MNRPDNILTYDEIDLKLGIKSSLPKVKSTVALAILFWECSNRPADIIYSVQNGNEIAISNQLKQSVIKHLMDICAEEHISSDDLIAVLNQNQLFKSQIESLMVAFELVWKLAKVNFVDNTKAASAERTGGARFPKKLTYSVNIDIVHSVISCNESAFFRVLLAWIGLDIHVDSKYEKILISLLLILSEGAIFKLSDGSKDVIFNQNSIYRKLLETGESVDVNGDSEAKGSLRILKTLLSEGMNQYLKCSNGEVSIATTYIDEIKEYQKRVDTLLRLNAKKVINLEKQAAVVEEVKKDKLEKSNITGGTNILLYGVPGCGKSYTIKTEYCNDEEHMERVVFHPDYSYSDFVGQILPRVFEGRIEYRFEPGPFSRILKKAIESKEENFYLVVEEINRGNAPAIFGDIFQLLDRDDSGCSEYGVNNENISNYVYGDIDTKIKIPSNLFVLATMNTSDQNVFTLDTAFKRRWTMRLIENRIDDCKFAGHEICGSKITWRVFVETINKKIIELGENNLGNEDNRLGAYFVREAELNEPERFGEKVLMYLWNDAFKFEHDKVFKADYHTLDELIAGFCREGFEVFSQDIDFGIETNDTDSKAELVNSMTEEQAMQTLPFSET